MDYDDIIYPHCTYLQKEAYEMNTAAWLGLDHWILPALGTPWRPGKGFRNETEEKPV
jgi:hypothetical protein